MWTDVASNLTGWDGFAISTLCPLGPTQTNAMHLAQGVTRKSKIPAPSELLAGRKRLTKPKLPKSKRGPVAAPPPPPPGVKASSGPPPPKASALGAPPPPKAPAAAAPPPPPGVKPAKATAKKKAVVKKVGADTPPPPAPPAASLPPKASVAASAAAVSAAVPPPAPKAKNPSLQKLKVPPPVPPVPPSPTLSPVVTSGKKVPVRLQFRLGKRSEAHAHSCAPMHMYTATYRARAELRHHRHVLLEEDHLPSEAWKKS